MKHERERKNNVRVVEEAGVFSFVLHFSFPFGARLPFKDRIKRVNKILVLFFGGKLLRKIARQTGF